jgi:hypothetical protein
MIKGTFPANYERIDRHVLSFVFQELAPAIIQPGGIVRGDSACLPTSGLRTDSAPANADPGISIPTAFLAAPAAVDQPAE